MAEHIRKSRGQELIEALEKWIASYVVFPEQIKDASLMLALFAFNTWIYKVWSSTPYLCITAATKGAAKTVTLEATLMLCKNPELTSGATPASIFRMADSWPDGWFTFGLDEAEKLNSNSQHAAREVLNPGYRAGATVPRAAKGGEGVHRFPVYFPKVFALIGDLYDTLRDRCIVITLERATPEQLRNIKRYRRDDAEREALTLRRQIEAFIPTLPAAEFQMQTAEWFSGREEEINSPLWSVLHIIGADAAMRERFVRIASDLAALKTMQARRFSELQRGDVEDDQMKRTYGEKAMRDLARVIKDGETGIFSVEAVQRMRALPDAPWRTFKGEGLTPNKLADLLSPFVGGAGFPKNIRIRAANEKGRGAGKVGSGYSRECIESGEKAMQADAR